MQRLSAWFSCRGVSFATPCLQTLPSMWVLQAGKPPRLADALLHTVGQLLCRHRDEAGCSRRQVKWMIAWQSLLGHSAHALTS